MLNLEPSKCIMKSNHTFEQKKANDVRVALLETLHGVGVGKIRDKVGSRGEEKAD